MLARVDYHFRVDMEHIEQGVPLVAPSFPSSAGGSIAAIRGGRYLAFPWSSDRMSASACSNTHNVDVARFA
jgi:hypothetical protein